MKRKKKADSKAKKSKNKIKQNKKKPIVVGTIVTGVVDMTKSGRAYILVENFKQDILVQKDDLHNALDGDKVRVKILYVSSKGKLEGTVVQVLERNQVDFIGRLEVNEHFGFVIPDNQKINFDIYLTESETKKAKDGDKVLVRITDWNEGAKNPVGIILENLGTERDNQIAMKEILIERGFRLQFSKETLNDLKQLPTEITQEEIAQRKDCRSVLTFTIDPKDAKDFDDAISFRKLKNGNFEVGVHIADVSHYVQPDTALDKDAYENATSVYLPDRVLPMLPEEISNVLCSLRPQEEKLTFSVIFQITPQAEIKQHWIGKTIIRSDKRYVYGEVQDIIEGKKDEHEEPIRHLNFIAQAIRKNRFERGAINFTSQEVRYVLDEESKPVGVEILENKEAQQLIEELMLLANRYVAKFVNKKVFNGQSIPFPYRVHPWPDELKLAQFAAFASRLGYKLNLSNHDEVARSFNEMLHQVSGQPEEHLLQQLGIRTMAKALYTTENEGHYGLGFENYCHFTSPIRRYPDVMVHRIVQEVLQNNISLDKKMEQKCRHCSEREKKAMDAERKANKYKQVEYMLQFLGEELEARVSGVSHMGFWAETVDQKCEGMINIAEIADIDHFEFIEEEYVLKGLHTGLRFRIGDTVIIRVDRADLESKTIDFGFVERKSNTTLKQIKEKKSKKTNKKPKK